MAATVLSSERAVEVSVYVVRAFVQLRGLLAANEQLPHELTAMEKRLSQKLHTPRSGDHRNPQYAARFDAAASVCQRAAPDQATYRLRASRGEETGETQGHRQDQQQRQQTMNCSGN